MDTIKEALGRGETKIKVRGEISEPIYAEMRVTNIRHDIISWDTPVNDLSFSIQSLTSGASGLSDNLHRIDNAHDFLHEHTSGASPISLGDTTLSGVVTTFYNRYQETAMSGASGLSGVSSLGLIGSIW